MNIIRAYPSDTSNIWIGKNDLTQPLNFIKPDSNVVIYGEVTSKQKITIIVKNLIMLAKVSSPDEITLHALQNIFWTNSKLVEREESKINCKTGLSENISDSQVNVKAITCISANRGIYHSPLRADQIRRIRKLKFDLICKPDGYYLEADNLIQHNEQGLKFFTKKTSDALVS